MLPTPLDGTPAVAKHGKYKCVLNVLLLSRDLQPITCVSFCLVIVFGDLLLDLTGFLAVHADLFTSFGRGKCKTCTLDSGLDYGLDCGLTFGLGIGPSYTAKGQLFNHG